MNDHPRHRAYSGRLVRAIGAIVTILCLTVPALAVTPPGAPPEVKLTASDAVGDDELGYRVAVDGDVAVLGAPGADAAYVYVRCGADWKLSARLTPGDGAAIGDSVAISGDTVLVGGTSVATGGAVYVFTRSDAGGWSQLQKLSNPDPEKGDEFGCSVAISGDTAVVGAWLDNGFVNDSGSAYVFTRTSLGAWYPQRKLLASDAAAGDHFGISVAVSGDRVVVGAYGNDDAGSSSGSAYVFERNGSGTWSERKLTGSSATKDGYFGYSVAIRGETTVVGAPGQGSESGLAYVFTRAANGTWSEKQKLAASDATTRGSQLFGLSVAVGGDTAVVGAFVGDGGAYVFRRKHSGTWTETRRLEASDGGTDDAFGYSVALSGDTVVVGALGDDDAATDAGAAYVYLLDTKLVASDAAGLAYFGWSVAVHGDTAAVGAFAGEGDTGAVYAYSRGRSGTWRERQKLTTTDTSAGEFGAAVAVHGDTILAGAPTSYGESGAAYIFSRDGRGTWKEMQTLRASGTSLFGAAVALWGDTAVLGAPGKEVFVFTRDQSGTWTEQQRLTPAEGGADDFGWSVAVSGDTIVVGDTGDGVGGSAYVFVRDGSGSWKQRQKLTAFDAAAKDAFGRSVAVSGDTAAIGASGDESSGGSAYVFTRDVLGNWNLQGKLRASNATAGDEFGHSVALSGDTTVVGAWKDSGLAKENGSAYVFTRSGSVWTERRKLTPRDTDGRPRLGVSVAVSGGNAIFGAFLDDEAALDRGAAYVFSHLGAGIELDIGTTVLPDTTVGADYHAEVRPLGGARPYRFDLPYGALPSSLRIGADTCVIEGVCDAAGTYTFIVGVNDPCGETTTQAYTITVHPAPEILTGTIPDATSGRPYGQKLTMTGGMAPYRWSLPDGALPVPGGLDPATGAFDGDALAPGDYGFTVRVTDAAGVTAERSFAVTVHPHPAIATTDVAPGTTGYPFAREFDLAGGMAPFTWSLASGRLPATGTVDPATGRLAGDALQPGTYEFTLRVIDANGAAALRSFAAVINELPRIATDTLPVALQFRPYRTPLEVTGGTAPFTWSIVEDEMPDTVDVVADTGVLTGADDDGFVRVEEEFAHKRSRLTLRCVDAAGALTERELTLDVADAADLARRKLKDELPINVLNGTSPVIRALELMAGTRLDVSLKFPGRGGAPVTLDVVDAGGRSVIGDAQTKPSARGLRVRGIIVPATGRYFIRVVPEAPFEGTVRLQAKVTPPKKLRGTFTSPAPRVPFEVRVGVMSGARVTVVAKRTRGSDAYPVIFSARVDSRSELVSSSSLDLMKGNKGSKLRLTAPTGGDLALRIHTLQETHGEFTWTVKIRQPKGYVFGLPTLAAGVAK